MQMAAEANFMECVLRMHVYKLKTGDTKVAGRR